MNHYAPRMLQRGRFKVLQARRNLLCKVAVLLVVYCVTLTLLVGDIGFQGDDWWVFSFPFWSSFPDSVYDYARESKRPVEGLYWISMFEVFRFSRMPYTLFSLLLLAGSCIAMGAGLLRAFPSRRDMAVLSVFFAFLLPPLCNLTFMIHTDNSRISNLLFWTSVLMFQQWASKARSPIRKVPHPDPLPGGEEASGFGALKNGKPIAKSYTRSWFGLWLPCACYLLAALTYENTTFLIFAVPAFVVPILIHSEYSDRSVVGLLIRLGAAIGVSFAAFVAMRFLVFSGGAVSHGSLIPSYSLVVSYFTVLAKYLWAPFTSITSDAWALGWGLLVSLTAAALLLLLGRRGGSAVEEDSVSLHEGVYIAFVGVAVLTLGVVPYLLAGYEANFGFTSQSRIYSSAAFGVAIILAAVLGATWTSKKLRLVTKCTAIALMAFMAIFFADLGGGWKDAATKRNDLCASLLKQVPGVKPGTTFLFLDLQWYPSDRAVVFQGVDGLPEFIRILYGCKDLYAYFLYPSSDLPVASDERTASVSPRGLVARGSAVRGPIPLDSLLIFRRRGSRLELLDGITDAEPQVAMKWNGVSVIRSNRDLIIGRLLGLNCE